VVTVDEDEDVASLDVVSEEDGDEDLMEDLVEDLMEDLAG
jgi:hypothetical protein